MILLKKLNIIKIKNKYIYINRAMNISNIDNFLDKIKDNDDVYYIIKSYINIEDCERIARRKKEELENIPKKRWKRYIKYKDNNDYSKLKYNK